MIDTRTVTRKPRAFGLALLLVCSLLWAQLLGLTHRVVHGPQLAGSVVALQAGSEVELASESGTSLFAPLFAGHQGADCSTFDQLSHADVLAGLPAQALPTIAPLPLLAVATVYLLLQNYLRPQARGPPLSL